MTYKLMTYTWVCVNPFGGDVTTGSSKGYFASVDVLMHKLAEFSRECGQLQWYYLQTEDQLVHNKLAPEVDPESIPPNTACYYGPQQHQIEVTYKHP